MPSTTEPTFRPSVNPSKRPSFKPTHKGGTSSPVIAPTIAPTFDSNYYNAATFQSYKNALTSYDDMKDGLNYGNFVYKGYQVDGNCDIFHSFIDNSLSIPSVEYVITEIIAWFEFESFALNSHQVTSSETFRCTDIEVINGLIDSMQSRTSFNALCQDHVWRSYVCEGSLVFCVDCIEDCQLPYAYDCPRDDSQYFLNPCTSCVGNFASGAILHVNTSRVTNYPLFISPLTIYDVMKTSMLVNITIDESGMIYCGA